MSFEHFRTMLHVLIKIDHLMFIAIYVYLLKLFSKMFFFFILPYTIYIFDKTFFFQYKLRDYIFKFLYVYIFVGKTVGSNILVVAMNRSQIGNENDVNELTSIDTTYYDLCSVDPITMYYSGVILSADDNKKAHQTLKRFLSF